MEQREFLKSEWRSSFEADGEPLNERELNASMSQVFYDCRSRDS